MMTSYLLRRINLLLVTLFILTIASYALAYLFPGEALQNLSGQLNPNDTTYAALSEKYAMDAHPIFGFFTYLGHLLHGDWGTSINSGKPVLDEILSHLPATLELSTYALFMSLLIGIPVGFWAGIRFHRSVDYAVMTGSVVGFSIPVFWLALILIMLFSLNLGLLPMSGRISLLFDIPERSGFIVLDILLSDIPNKREALYNAFLHMILPTLSITIVTSAVVMRITRRSVADVIQSDYIKAAIARGLSRTQAMWRHGVRNALLPIMPQIVMQFTVLLTNAMIVELIFSWPGIGNWLLQAIYQRDYPAISGGMLAVSAVVIFFTLTMDVLVRALNPLKRRDVHGTI